MAAASLISHTGTSRTLGRSPALSAPVYYRPGFQGAGQGKTATTILADQGDIVTVVSDVPYVDRSRRRTWADRPAKGSRSMHQSTLVIPNQKYTDYDTTLKRVHAASRTLETDEVPHPYPSQHRSQISFAHRGQDGHLPWHSQYKTLFFNKPTDLPSRIHYPTWENKVNNTEGGDVRRVMRVVELAQPHVTQYARVHNKLGVLLGPGVGRHQSARRQYNILTGEDVGSAWHPENRKISGNRVLYNDYRKDANCHFVLG